MKVMIFGAKSLALGACRALQALYGEHLVGGFLVTSLEDNAEVLNGLPVMEIQPHYREEGCAEGILRVAVSNTGTDGTAERAQRMGKG